MSTAEIVDQLNALWDEKTQCSICLECFDEEIRVKTFLDCRHYFCLFCIKECRSLPGSSGKEILCPICRSKTSCEELAKLHMQNFPQGLHHLLQTLGEPRTPERDRQIVTILRSNPQLMAAFVKQRSILLQRGFHHLLQTLGEPRTPERERQIVTILHSNPLLMAAFVKQRSILLQRNQNPQL